MVISPPQRRPASWPQKTDHFGGYVSIVGAGPGQPDLLSVRGLRLIQEADAVLYDALLAEAEFKALFNDRAEAIFVGKRSANHRLSQAQINDLLVTLARQGKAVVRLKGGDPCVFGRGAEEALHLRQAGIPFEIVPGISSINGIGAAVGIPLTHRQLARQFLVFEGHDLAALDWPLLAKFTGTLVGLMASTKAADIATRLVACGADPALPIALVESGDFSAPVTQTSTLGETASHGLSKSTAGPGIIYIGATVSVLR